MCSDISRLRKIVAEDRIKPLSSLIGAIKSKKSIYLQVDIDEAKTSYEKGREKDYVFSDKINYSDEYRSIISCELLDYGVDDTTGKLVRDFSSSDRDMSLSVDWSAPETMFLLNGSFFGDAGHVENLGYGLKAELEIVGTRASAEPDLHQELLIEGFSMEGANNRLALFCYFSAIECVILSQIDEYKRDIAQELHYSLERLSMTDKLRILVRQVSRSPDMRDIEIWGETISALDGTAKIRNLIAHPRSREKVEDEDVSQAFLSFLLIHSILIEKHFFAADIIKAHCRKARS